eukprot:5023514-Amphidinium_carterae.1
MAPVRARTNPEVMRRIPICPDHWQTPACQPSWPLPPPSTTSNSYPIQSNQLLTTLHNQQDVVNIHQLEQLFLLRM